MDKEKQREDQEAWTKESIMNVEIDILEKMIGSRTVKAVEACICYARFLRLSGLTNNNYPLFLKLLEVENHWVIDSLIGTKDPFLLLSPIQPNNYLILQAYKLLTNWHGFVTICYSKPIVKIKCVI